MTLQPLDNSRSARWLPMNPAQPVMNAVICMRSSARSGDFCDGQREGLQEVEVRAPQCELGMPRVAQPRELIVVRAGQIRPQTLSPGTSKNRLQKVGFVRGIERRYAL